MYICLQPLYYWLWKIPCKTQIRFAEIIPKNQKKVFYSSLSEKAESTAENIQIEMGSILDENLYKSMEETKPIQGIKLMVEK